MEFEKKKNEIEEAFGRKILNLNSKFGTGGVDFVEEHKQSSDVVKGGGLISKQEL